MSDKDLTTATGIMIGISQKQWDIIGSKTPKDKIKQRPGRGGKTFDYVETGYIVDLLNSTFNGLWDFEIDEQEVGTTQVWVKGKLTVWITPEMKITKTQFGGSDIKKTSEGKPVDVADDLKAASSDCLKKCASLLGFAKDIYWKEKTIGTTPTQNASSSSVVGVGKPTDKQINYINALCSQKGIDREEMKTKYKVESMKDLNYEQGQAMIKELLTMPDVDQF
jgi:recombination DNA repair RAD52 pathway protein